MGKRKPYEQSITASNPQAVRVQNRRAVLDLIEHKGPIPRVELAGALGLSPPTVSEVVAELVKAGLVVEAGFGSSTGGRRPVMLRFNDRAGYIVAVNLGGTKSQLATFTLRGEQIDCINTPLPRAQTAEEAVSIIMNDISALTSRGSIPKEQLCAVGIAVPGVVDPESGEVTFAPAIGLKHAALGGLLQSELGLPVIVDNDVNAAALAELEFGEGRQFRSFVLIWIGTGVGAGIVIDGKLHRGYGNFAGEIGYFIVDSALEESRLAAGFGPFEDRVGLPNIIDQMVQQDSSFVRPSELQYKASFEEIIRQSDLGKEPASAIINDLVDSLSKVLVNIMLVIAPDVIFLGGAIGNSADLLLPRLKDRMNVLSPITPQLRITNLAENAGLIGAAALASRHAHKLLLAGIDA